MISPQNSDSFLVFAMVVFLALEIIEDDLDPEGDQGQRPEPGDLAERQHVEIDELKNDAEDQDGYGRKEGEVFPACFAIDGRTGPVQLSGLIVTVNDLE